MFLLDYKDGVPIYEQIVTQTYEFVLSGVLAAGEKMPSVRALSMKLSVNPNTIQRAYTQLSNDGVLGTVAGKGVFVSQDINSVFKTAYNETMLK